MKRYNRLSSRRITKIIRCFRLDIDASKTAELLRLNRKTANRYYGLSRAAIYAHQVQEAEKFCRHVEVDESYFGASRLRQARFQAWQRHAQEARIRRHRA